MDELIPVINHIRDSLAVAKLEFSIELPSIVVVGGQSVGKSSLLEFLVGHSFLPTGRGVVTRRPLVLRLVNTGGVDKREWGEFGHLPGSLYDNFDDIREEIERDTEYICDRGEGISSAPIVLQISSPRVPNLTLVDLPGIIHVPIGNQAVDVEQQVRDLVFEYISPPHCLILAVISGSADLATADSLAVARVVDPDSRRTVGVITKLDLADQASSEYAAVLEGKVYPLQRGFVGVMMRRDTRQANDLNQHLETERQFFQNSVQFKRFAHRCGTAYLAKHLSGIMMGHISEALPDIKVQVLQMIRRCESELQAYGEAVESQPPNPGAVLLNLITKFAGSIGDNIEGRASGQQDTYEASLMVRARIDFIFNDIFARTVREFDFCDGLSDDTICTAIRNATGPGAALFVPEAAFEMLARRQISKLEHPSLQCSDLIFNELERVLLNVSSDMLEFRRFESLRENILGVAREVLQQCLTSTKKMIKDLIQIELAYINTHHQDFVSAPNKAPHGSSAPAYSGPSSVCSSTETYHESEQRFDATLKTLEGALSRMQGGGSSFSSANTGEDDLKHSGLGLARAGGAIPTAERIAHGGILAPGGVFSGLNKFNRSLSASTEMLSESAVAPKATPAPSSSTLRLPSVLHGVTTATSPPTRREMVEVRMVKTLLEKYICIVRKNIADSVPKAVMCFMVVQLKETVQSECIAQLYKEQMFPQLFREAADITNRRENCREQLAALQNALDVMEQVGCRAEA